MVEDTNRKDKPEGLFSDRKDYVSESNDSNLLSRFYASSSPRPPLSAAAQLPPYRPVINRRLIILIFSGALLSGLLAAYGLVVFPTSSNQPAGPDKVFLPDTPGPTPSATPLPSPAPTRPFAFLEPTVLPTPAPGGRILILTPAAQTAGWIVSSDESLTPSFEPPNHFGDGFLYAGVLDGKIYHGAFQFDLSDIPRGVKLYGAGLRLTGARGELLAEDGEGVWRLQLLSPELDLHWLTATYRQIHRAATWATLRPILTQGQLGQDQTNHFEFKAEQLALLERRILESSDEIGRKVSFRLDGPPAGDDNLFAWASGAGPGDAGVAPELLLNLGPPPQETPPPYYVIITSTPTPENVMTAAAVSQKMTVAAARFGTATPPPPYWATPLVVTATPIPQNQATAQAASELATALALTTGEPAAAVVATPTPTYVIITSTPTPESVMTAAAEARRITAQAIRVGPSPSLPPNWVTPIVVTSSPTPANTATVAYLQAIALTTGTPTATPGNVQTATPTPVFVTVAPLASPSPTATPSPTPRSLPLALLNKIIFLSDREGAAPEELARVDALRQAGDLEATPQITPQPYVLDPETGQLGRLTDIWPYKAAVTRDAWSADAVYETYTQKLLWTNVEDSEGVRTPTEVLAIHVYDHTYKTEQIVTRMGAGITYDPAWSPAGDEIVFVATESGNDEIWVIKRDGTQARQLTHNDWQWDKHPSWSPDGRQIVFYSNRTGNNQIWIMNKDGDEQRLLMDWTPYNDWAPVWVKYIDPPPPLKREPDWRFRKPPEESR